MAHACGFLKVLVLYAQVQNAFTPEPLIKAVLNHFSRSSIRPI